MVEWLNVVLIGLAIVNTTLHAIGIHLLWWQKKVSHLRIHHIYLISLSASELTMNFLEVIKISINMNKNLSNTMQQISYHIMLVQFTGTAIVFHFSMIFITIDRLLEILLNIKYPVYWNEHKATKLLIGLWVISGLLTITVGICKGLADFQWENYFFTYFYPTVEFFFIILAFASYLFIFKKFNTTRVIPIHVPTLRIPRERQKDDEYEMGDNNSSSPKPPPRRQARQRRSSITTFRKSRFFIPVLLILTFLIFIVGADMIMLFVVVMAGNNSTWLLNTLAISYSVSNFLDAWIYIFLEPELKTLLWRKIGNIFRKRNDF
uniref:7 transmembrane protein n=1 Tax=Clytia hemisphaerica TaxID=252671 RepID=A0A069DMH9_9CNID